MGEVKFYLYIRRGLGISFETEVGVGVGDRGCDQVGQRMGERRGVT